MFFEASKKLIRWIGSSHPDFNELHEVFIEEPGVCGFVLEFKTEQAANDMAEFILALSHEKTINLELNLRFNLLFVKIDYMTEPTPSFIENLISEILKEEKKIKLVEEKENNNHDVQDY